MTLLNALTDIDALTRIPKGPLCSVKVAKDKMDAKERAALDSALGNHAIPSTRLANALTENGHPVKPDAVRRHRKRGSADGCRCEA